MKVLYLTWGETPKPYGVFGSQVIRQFAETAKICPDGEFHFASAVPLLNSGVVRDRFGYFDEIRKIKFALGNIKFHLLPIYALQNFFNSTKITFGLMHGIAHAHLKKLLLEIKPNIIHCRSYHAAWAALQVRKKIKLDYRIIFDGRGLWPEEVGHKKNWSPDSVDYKFLKTIEKLLLTECDLSVSVSDTMHAHYKCLGAKNDNVIYLSASNEELVTPWEGKRRSDAIRFCYVGALSESTWHQPKALKDLYAHLRTIYPKTRLTIVTTSDHKRLKEIFSDLDDEEIFLTSAKNRSDLKKIFIDQDFGLMSYFDPSNENEKKLGEMVLAVKVAEYLSAGLPVICNKYCGGAAMLLDKYQLGFSYDSGNLKMVEQSSLSSFFSEEAFSRCVTFSSKNFDYAVNAIKYRKLYLDCLN